MTGTGLKKCMPTKRSGCDINDGSLVTGIEEVFDAMIASPLTDLSTFEDLRLQVVVLGGRFNDDIGRVEIRVGGGAVDAPERSSFFSCWHLAFGDKPGAAGSNGVTFGDRRIVHIRITSRPLVAAA
jgi:hypothetical protein